MSLWFRASGLGTGSSLTLFNCIGIAWQGRRGKVKGIPVFEGVSL